MRQIVLDFSLEKDSISKEYKTGILSFFKNCLSQSNEEFFNEMYDKQFIKEKNFCFSVYFKGMKYLKNEIKLGSKYMRVIFSTSDMIIMAKYYNAFLKQKGSSYPIFDNVVKLEKISYINVSDIDSNEIIIKMLSPLIVRKHEDNNKDTYLTFNDADFEKVLKENLLKTYSNLSVDISEFKIEPVKASKTVTNILRGTASASLGIFKLTGSVKLLNLLLQSGLGSRRGLGNGMFTVLG